MHPITLLLLATETAVVFSFLFPPQQSGVVKLTLVRTPSATVANRESFKVDTQGNYSGLEFAHNVGENGYSIESKSILTEGVTSRC
jgi:hypothetical protein